jgi:hypothetical protein
MKLNRKAWGEICDLPEKEKAILFNDSGFGKAKEIINKVDPLYGNQAKKYNVIVEQKRTAEVLIEAANEKHAAILAKDKAHELDFDHEEYGIFAINEVK